MSQYLNLFLRMSDYFAPLGVFPASSQLYAAFQGLAPQEKVTNITEAQLRDIRDIMRGKVERLEKELVQLDKDIKEIMDANNSLDEKCQYIAEYVNPYLMETKQLLDENKHGVAFTEMLIDLLDGVEWRYDINEDRYLYAGIECARPDLDDVIEKDSQ